WRRALSKRRSWVFLVPFHGACYFRTRCDCDRSADDGAEHLDLGWGRRRGKVVSGQAGVMAVDIDQRVDRAMNAHGDDAAQEDRMRAVVDALVLGADDAGLRLG